jgi:hypothetical protein
MPKLINTHMNFQCSLLDQEERGGEGRGGEGERSYHAKGGMVNQVEIKVIQ